MRTDALLCTITRDRNHVVRLARFLYSFRSAGDQIDDDADVEEEERDSQ